MEVKLVKLITGEEVVAQVVEFDSYIEMTNPVKFVMAQNPNGGYGIEMHPFVMLSEDENISIGRENIMFICSPIADVLSTYDSQFSEIVIPPEKQLII